MDAAAIISTVPRYKAPLTNEEFEALKEVAKGTVERSIPNKHRNRLLDAGYVREIVPRSGGESVLALTGMGFILLEPFRHDPVSG